MKCSLFSVLHSEIGVGGGECICWSLAATSFKKFARANHRRLQIPQRPSKFNKMSAKTCNISSKFYKFLTHPQSSKLTFSELKLLAKFAPPCPGSLGRHVTWHVRPQPRRSPPSAPLSCTVPFPSRWVVHSLTATKQRWQCRPRQQQRGSFSSQLTQVIAIKYGQGWH